MGGFGTAGGSRRASRSLNWFCLATPRFGCRIPIPNQDDARLGLAGGPTAVRLSSVLAPIAHRFKAVATSGGWVCGCRRDGDKKRPAGSQNPAGQRRPMQEKEEESVAGRRGKL